MNKKISILISSLVVLLPGFVSALTIEDMVDGAVDTTLYIADGVIVILWVITGLLFLLAQGAPDKLTAAKKALIAAAVGTLLVIIANSAVYLIGNAFHAI